MKKTTKILSIILALVMVLSIIPIATFAADDDFVIENGVLTSYNGAGGDVVIPDGVTSIGNSAFYNCESLTSVEIPDGVTSIGNSAFNYCLNVTSIEIPDSVTSIGDEAFSYCVKLESIEIPDGITSIAYAAFYSCIALKSVTIPGSVTSIGEYAFCWCDSLTDVYFTGTEEQRNAMNIDSYNLPFKEATIHFIAEHEHAFSEEWTTDATAHWHECTAEDCNIKNYAKSTVDGIAYGAHTFVDGICTVCGAKHQHTFAKEWTINETAHWHECTAEDCDIEDYATCGIAEAAYGEHADADGNFYCDACNYFFAVAFYKEKFKADIKDNLLPAAVCDEAREILNKAYEDLDTAVTINDVQSIYNTAKGMSGGKNSDFTSKLNSYKSIITINLGDSPAAARDNFVENTINALENSQSIAELDKAFNNGTSQISYYKSTDANVNAFNNKINSGELSDKSIALAQEAIEKINEAKTYEEVSALSNQYHGKIDTQIAKEKASAELNTIAEEKNDSRVDAIVSEALAAIDEATAVMDINDIKAEAIAAIEALPTEPAGDVKKVVCEPGADEYRTFAATVENHAVKIQIVDESGSTVTFTRDNPKVSIQAYDADGNEVEALDKSAAYEVWTISNQYLAEGKYTAICKNADNVWDAVEDGCEFDVVYSRDDVAVIAVIPSVIEAKRCEKFDVEVATGGDVLKVTIQYNGVNYKTFTPSGKNSSGMNIFDCFVAADTYGDAKITVRYKTADGWFDCTDVYDIVSIGNVTTPRRPL